MDGLDAEPPSSSSSNKVLTGIAQRYQFYLDQWTPHTLSRWLFTCALLVCFLLRVLILQGWYIVTYALFIYHLNMLIGFLSPKLDPAFEMYEATDGEGPSLPTRSSDEFRPFVRRLPEFKFWYSVSKATVIAFCCTFFEFFNIPVFWPILVMYFVMLFCITMKRQIKHMFQYKYVPFTWGKPKYTSVSSDS